MSSKFSPELLAMISDSSCLDLTMCNAPFTDLVFANLQKTGKKFRELTVGEAITLIESSHEEYNARFKA